MTWIDGTDWTDITPEMPPFLAGPLEVVGAIATAIALTIVTVSALLILVRYDKGGPVLWFGGAVLASLILAAIRGDWFVAAYAVLILPAYIGIRWIYRRFSTSY